MPTDTIFREYNHIDSDHTDRSAGDRARHREKIRDSMREGIADILSEQSIIGQKGDKVIKVPIKGIREYRFVFGGNQPDTTSGDGSEQPGDVIGQRHTHKPGQPGQGGGKGAGTDVYETDITIDELIEIMFEDLQLPEMDRKQLQEIQIDSVKRRGYRRKGIRVRLDAKRSIAEKLKRKAGLTRLGVKEDEIEQIECENSELTQLYDSFYECERCGQVFEHPLPKTHTRPAFPFRADDLRYKHMKVDTDTESNALVLCMMDDSGSMDVTKKYLARCFFFFLYKWVTTQYHNVEVVFISHHSTAKEVSEEDFFHAGESGGTIVSSAYEEAIKIIDKRYHPSLWNIYAFHCSDGDNYPDDNTKAIKLAKELLSRCKLFGYGEIVPKEAHGALLYALFGGGGGYEYDTLLKIYTKECQKEPEAWNGFFGFRCGEKKDIWPMLKLFLGREKK